MTIRRGRVTIRKGAGDYKKGVTIRKGVGDYKKGVGNL